jgi:hypothetical protein
VLRTTIFDKGFRYLQALFDGETICAHERVKAFAQTHCITEQASTEKDVAVVLRAPFRSSRRFLPADSTQQLSTESSVTQDCSRRKRQASDSSLFGSNEKVKPVQ